MKIKKLDKKILKEEKSDFQKKYEEKFGSLDKDYECSVEEFMNFLEEVINFE